MNIAISSCSKKGPQLVYQSKPGKEMLSAASTVSSQFEGVPQFRSCESELYSGICFVSTV